MVSHSIASLRSFVASQLSHRFHSHFCATKFHKMSLNSSKLELYPAFALWNDDVDVDALFFCRDTILYSSSHAIQEARMVGPIPLFLSLYFEVLGSILADLCVSHDARC
jgi:hypothetical protein